MTAILRRHLKPFEKYFKTPSLIELCINQPGEVYLETVDGWQVVNDANITLESLVFLSKALATHTGQAFNDEHPLLSTAIPGYGYRIQVIGGTLVESGIAMSIRVGTARKFPLESYMDEATAEKVKKAISSKKNILVAGGTSSGKTTFINSIITYIEESTRILCVEDTKELIFTQPNTVRILKSKTGTDIASITYKDIINACMRFRPDRIILGELDIENTVPFLRLLNTGHGGGMATVHADSAKEALEAVVMNAQLAGMQGPVERWASQSIHVVIHLHRENRTTYRALVDFKDGR